MLVGTCPSDVTVRQAAIYKLAVKLAQMRGPLNKESFNESVAVLGLDGVGSAIQQPAAFINASMMMNVGHVAVPVAFKDADSTRG